MHKSEANTVLVNIVVKLCLVVLYSYFVFLEGGNNNKVLSTKLETVRPSRSPVRRLAFLSAAEN